MLVVNNHALLVGVEDYSVYDFSLDQPKGTSDIRGATNDARTFFRHCIDMGIAPDHIRVLTSPELSPAELGPEATAANVGPATRASISAGIDWLTGAISGAAPASGLLTFSGHGVQEGNVALCPSDTTADLNEAIEVADIIASLGKSGVADRLTMVLDCCHAEVLTPRGERLQSRLRARAALAQAAQSVKSSRPAKAQAHNTSAARVLSACRSDQTSAWSVFGGAPGGAFTWAVTSAMSQWRTTVEGGVARLDVSYGEIVKRANALLSALSFEQQPALSGPPHVADLPFLHPGDEVHDGEAVPLPNRTRVMGQLEPDSYAVVMQNGTVMTNLASISVSATTETWTVDQVAATNIMTATQITLDRVGTLPTINNPLTETAATVVKWKGTTNAAYPTVGRTFVGTYTYATHSGTATGTLAINFQTATTPGGAAISVTKWYNPDTSGANVNLSTGGVAITMTPATTGTYSGTCNVGTSPLTY